MYTGQPRKLTVLCVLEVLKEYSDQDHRLSPGDILELLEQDYGVATNRRTLRSYLADLMDWGYEIEYTERPRLIRDPETGREKEVPIRTDYYLVRPFTDGELRFLIDSLRFSRNLPGPQCRALMEKLERQSSQYFRARVSQSQSAAEQAPRNPQFFYTVETLDEAISRGRQVSFTYLEYGADLKLHKRCRPDGTVRAYRISPYQMAAREGRYYLICNKEGYDTVAHYRVDRIAEIRMLETPVRPFETLEGASRSGLDLAGYMARHAFMCGGACVTARLRVTKGLISDVIDLFGTSVTISRETKTHVELTLPDGSEDAVLQFVKRYAPEAVLLSPAPLAARLRAAFTQAAELHAAAGDAGQGTSDRGQVKGKK